MTRKLTKEDIQLIDQLVKNSVNIGGICRALKIGRLTFSKLRKLNPEIEIILKNSKQVRTKYVPFKKKDQELMEKAAEDDYKAACYRYKKIKEDRYESALQERFDNEWYV